MGAVFLNKVILIFCLNINWVDSYTHDDADKLIKDKLANYNKKIRPVQNQSEPLDIYIGFDIVAIQDFDEVLEKFTPVVIVGMYWHDKGMSWNPDDYNGLDVLVTESRDFWRPKLIITNSVSKFEMLGEDWTIVRYNSNGMAYMNPGSIFSASCSVDVAYYPWDKQFCQLTFAAWGFDRNEVRLVPYSDTVSSTYYTENGVWNITGSKVFNVLQFITMELNMERKPNFIVFNVILPIVFMSFLNIIVFMVPIESGERISYCLTVLLAIAVFLTLVGDNLPKKSNPMSILSFYLLSILIISLCVTVMTIVSLIVHFRDEEVPVPQCLVSFVRCLRCRRHNKRPHKQQQSRSRDSRDSDTHIDDSDKAQDHHHSNIERPFIQNRRYENGASKQSSPTRGTYSGAFKTGSSIYSHYYLSDIRDRTISSTRPHQKQSKYANQSKNVYDKSNEDENKEDKKVSWKDVSAVLDMFFFIGFTILLTTDTVMFWLAMTQVIELK